MNTQFAMQFSKLSSILYFKFSDTVYPFKNTFPFLPLSLSGNDIGCSCCDIDLLLHNVGMTCLPSQRIKKKNAAISLQKDIDP